MRILSENSVHRLPNERALYCIQLCLARNDTPFFNVFAGFFHYPMRRSMVAGANDTFLRMCNESAGPDFSLVKRLPAFDESSKGFLNMPIYEYQCEGCEYEFESLQRMSEPPLTQCPSCGKDLLKKKISAVAFRLKGGGWYETDFKSGDKKNVASSSDSGGESTSSGASSSPRRARAKVEQAMPSRARAAQPTVRRSRRAMLVKERREEHQEGAKNGSPKSAPKSESEIERQQRQVVQDLTRADDFPNAFIGRAQRRTSHL